MSRSEVTLDWLVDELGPVWRNANDLKRRFKARQPINPSEILALGDELERLTAATRECAADHQSQHWIARGAK